MKFEKEIQKNIDGGSKMYPFQKLWDTKAQEFRKLLAETRPLIKMPPQRRSLNGGTPTQSPVKSQDTVAIEIDSDDSPTQKTPTYQTGSKRPHMSSPATPTPIKIQRTSTDTLFRPAPKVAAKTFEMSEVQSIIQDAYVGGIPGQIHPKGKSILLRCLLLALGKANVKVAIEEMVQTSMAHWHEPLEIFLRDTRQLLESMVVDEVHTVFGQHLNTRYFDMILEACEIFLEGLFAKQGELARQILTWELSKPKTLDINAMSIARDKAFTLLQEKSRTMRAMNVIEDQEIKNGKPTIGVRKDKVARLADKEIPPEPFSRELHAISDVKAFYEIAYSRFVDIICSSISFEIFGRCRNDLFTVLRDRFGVTEPNGKRSLIQTQQVHILTFIANERLAIWLAANPRDEEKRVRLLKEKMKIDKAQQQLQRLM